jgi:hypothetical protein
VFVNGAESFIARELPEHVVATYLPHQSRAETPYGVESVSIGAATVLRTMRRDPQVFNTVGLIGMFCHAQGLLPERDFGSAAERRDFYAALASRVRRENLVMRFSIGAADILYGCNFGLYRAMQHAGVFPEGEPTYGACSRGTEQPSVRRCATHWPGYHAYPHVGHHYLALLPAFPPELDWNLEQLNAMLPRLAPTRPAAIARAEPSPARSPAPR